MRLDRSRILWWAAVVLVAVVGLIGRVWNLDFDDRQHLHPDERHWSLVASSMAAEQPDAVDAVDLPVVGPVATWLHGQRSPANPYRVTETFVYGPATLAWARSLSGWLADGVVDGRQPADLVARTVDTLGVPLIDDAGAPRFDDGYNVDLVGRLLGAVLDTMAIVVIALAGRRLGALMAPSWNPTDPDRVGRTVGLLAASVHACSVLAIQHTHFLGSEPALSLASALVVLALTYVDRGDSYDAAIRSGALVGAAAGAVVAIKVTGLGLVAGAFGLLALLLWRHRRRADVVRLAAAGLGAVVSFRLLCPAAFRGWTLFPDGTMWADLRRSSQLASGGLPPSIQWANRVPVLEPIGWLVRDTVGPGATIAAIAGIAWAWRSRRIAGTWAPAVVAVSVLAPLAFPLRDHVTTGRYFVPMLPGVAIAGAIGLAALAARVERRRGRLGAASLGVLCTLVVLWPVAFLASVHQGPHTRVEASRWIGAHVAEGSVLTVEGWDDGLPLAVDGVQPTAYESVQLDLFGPDSTEKTAQLATTLATVDYVVESSPRVWATVTRIPSRYPSTIRFFAGLDDGSLGFRRVATFTDDPITGVVMPWGSDESFSVVDHPEVRIWERVDELGGAELFARLDPRAAAGAVNTHPYLASANGGQLTVGERARLTDSTSTFDQEFATRGVLGNGWVQALLWTVFLAIVVVASTLAVQPLTRRLPDAGLGAAPAIGLVLVLAMLVVGSGYVGVPYGRSATLVAVFVLVGVAVWRARRIERWPDLIGRRPARHACAALSLGWVVGLALRAANPDLWHRFRGGEKPFELAMLTSVLRSSSLPPADAWYSGGAMNYYYGGSAIVAIPARLLGTVPHQAMNLGLAMVMAFVAGAAFTAGCALATGAGRGGRTDGVAAGWLAAGAVLLVPNLTIVAAVADRLRGGGGSIDWWSMSRVVEQSPIVTEFPAWSFLFGDLHAHVIGLVVVLPLVTVVALFADRLARGEGSLAVAALTGLLVGATRMVNAWDLPLAAWGFAAALGVVAVATRVTLRSLVLPVAVAVTSALTVWHPFVARFEVENGGVVLNRRFTDLTDFGEQFGWWAAVTAVVVVASWNGGVRPRGRLGIGAVAATLAGGAVLIVSGRATAAVAGLLGAAALGAAQRARVTRVAMPLVVVAVGWSVVVIAELVMVRDDFDRMNTVFKWWFHAWVLLSVGLAAAVGPRVAWSWTRLRRSWRAAAATASVVVAALLAVSFVRLAVPARLDDRTSTPTATLDGLAYLDDIGELSARDVAFDPAEDEPLIAWLQATVRGRPTILEAPGEGYAWASRVSGLTGLPTVIGWPYHQSQQRRPHGVTVDQRAAEASLFYTSADPDARLDVLWRHDIRYVVFGTRERVIGGDPAVVRSTPCTQVVFEDGRTFVAAVDQECVRPRALAWSYAREGRPATSLG